MYVQYGCGLSAPKEWENYDVSPTLLLSKVPVLGSVLKRKEVIPDWPSNVKYGDVVKGLPIKDESCKAIYCSHVLEHLSLEDLRKALKNTYALLMPGGVFRLVVPDLEAMIDEYIQEDDKNAALKFMDKSSLGKRRRLKGYKGALEYVFGNSSHLWMWDFKALENELKTVGFKKIRRAKYGDSTLEIFNLVEEKGRWENCLGAECTKE